MAKPRGTPFTSKADPDGTNPTPPPPPSGSGTRARAERTYRFEPRPWIVDAAKDWPPTRIVCEARHAPKGAWQWVAEEHDIVGVSGPGAPDAETQARGVVAELFEQARHWTMSSGKRCDVRLIIYRPTGDPVETRPVRLDRDGEEDSDSDVGDSADVLALMRSFIREEHRYFIEERRVSVSMIGSVADAIDGIATSIQSLAQAIERIGKVDGATEHDKMEHEATMRMYDTLDDIAERIVTPVGEALGGLISGRKAAKMKRPDKDKPWAALASELLQALDGVAAKPLGPDEVADLRTLAQKLSVTTDDGECLALARSLVDVIRPHADAVKKAWPKRALQLVDEMAVRVFHAQRGDG